MVLIGPIAVRHTFATKNHVKITNIRHDVPFIIRKVLYKVFF